MPNNVKIIAILKLWKLLLNFLKTLKFGLKWNPQNVWNQIKYKVNTYFTIYLLMV